MADNFGARIDGKYRVVYSAPDVCFDPGWKPIPFPSQETLDKSKKHAKKTNFNGFKVFTLKSDTDQVSADKLGTNKGLVSRTVEEKAEPFEPFAAQSANVEGGKVIRVGDTVYMNNKNTIGKVVFQAAPSESDITDEGKISPEPIEQSMFDDLTDWMANGAKNIAKVAATAQSVLALTGKSNSTLATATAATGALGSMLGSPVILRTGQLAYDESLIELAGSMPLLLTLHYVSRDANTGYFGKHRFFEYEKYFEKLSDDKDELVVYRLYLADGRKFDFVYNDKTSSFEDKGGLGVTVAWNEKQFDLHYNGGQQDGKKEIYQNCRLIKQIDLNGNYIDLSYNHTGQLIQISNNSEAYFNFSYRTDNSHNCIAEAKDQSGRAWRFEYDEFSNLQEISTPSGGKRLYNYQRFSESNNTDAYLLTAVTNSLNHPILVASYNKAGQVAIYKELEDSIEYQYSYADQSTIAKTSEHDDSLTYHLDEHGLVDSITLENGQSISQNYDAKTRTATIKHYSGTKETKVFDKNSRLIKHTDITGEETDYQYEGGNPEPSLIKLQTGDITNKYDSNYNLLSTIDEKGRKESYQYNSRGDITQVTDVAKNKTQYQYNSFSKPEAIIDAKGNTTKVEYDALGREYKLIDAEGRETSVTYNQDDSIKQFTDSLNNSIGFSFSHERQLQSLRDPAGNTTHFEFDQNGRLSRQTKPNNATIEYQYTKQGKVSQVSRVDDSIIRLEHNDNGLLIRHIADSQITEFEYDERDSLIGAKSQHSTLKFSYNNKGDIDSEEQNGIIVEKAFSKQVKTSLKYLDREITFLRNPDGLLDGILHNDKPAIRFKYDKNQDMLTQREYANNQKEKIRYNEQGGIKKIKTAQKTTEYQNDKTGLITTKGKTEYKYDNSGRLIRAGDETYHYDALGNLSHRGSYENPINPNQKNQYHPATNQLLENQTHRFTYDARGNLKSKIHKQNQATLFFEFNSLDQLVRVSGEQYNSKTQQTERLHLEYQYDALNRRITKATNGKIQHYLYDQLNIIAILDENHQTIAAIVHDDKIDTPLSITNKNGTFYYHRDHQGSIIALTNEDGETVESIKYDNSYGKILEHQRTVETNNPYCYTGRELDTYELYFYRARYYDPIMQAFLSEDPIGFLSGDYNFYRYVGNDPVNYYDPNGLKGSGGNKKKTDKGGMCEKIFILIPETVGSVAGGVVGTVAGGAAGTLCGPGAPGCVPAGAAAGRALGAAGGGAAGEWVGEQAGELVCDPIEEVIDDVKNTVGMIIYGLADIACGEISTYKTEKVAGKGKAEAMERDHIPNTATMRKRLKTEKTYRRATSKQKKCMEGAIKRDAPTLGMPKCLHAAGRTYRGSGNNLEKENASLDTMQKADLDQYSQILEGNYSVIKRSTDERTKAAQEKAKKCMDKMNEECKKGLKEGVEKQRKEKPDTFMQKTMDKCTPKEKKDAKKTNSKK